MTAALVVAEKAHATLGASSASRWMACPGSVRLSHGIPNIGSEYAREGTAAHALAELALRKNASPDLWVGLTLEGVEVTEEMAENVGVFVDFCRNFIEDSTETWIEQKFSLAELNPPGPMFGTADFVAYDADIRQLTVVDLKYGQGVIVEAEDNPQLRYYGLGAALALGKEREIDYVNLVIVQPRASHPLGVIREDAISYLELVGFSGDLLHAARATLAPDAPLIPGSHCRFCPASGACPAQLSRAQEIAQVEFSAMPAEGPPVPSLMTSEELGDFGRKLHVLEDWAKALRATIQNRIEHGDSVPGFKLVEKRATRKWSMEEQTRQWLAGAGYGPDEIEDRSLKSPAQIEKVMGKRKKELPAEFVSKVSSGYTLAAESDPRPAMAVSAGEEFAVLAAG